MSSRTYRLLSRWSVFVFVLLSSQVWPTSSISETEATKSMGGSDGKNILIYMGLSTYSMRIAMWPLFEGLMEKGHHLTLLSAQEPKVRDPRVTDYAPKKLQEWYIGAVDEIDFISMRRSGEHHQLWYSIPDFSAASCEQIFTDPEAVEWIRKSNFDLVVVDSTNECGYGLAHYFNAKTVVYSTFTNGPWFYDAFGIPGDDSWVSDMVYYYPAFEPTFISRVVAAVDPLVWKYIREHSHFPKLEEITKKGLGLDSIPSFRDLERNASLVLVKTHYAQEYARSFPPNVISIGGLALTGKVKPLPKELEEFIKKGKNGFIYISFGTVFNIKKLEKAQKNAIVNALKQFPDIQFIWKADGGIGEELPQNFLVTSWVPQQDLLAHPNIRAFVTHGGLGSMNEAIYHGVPMVAFPIFSDQDYDVIFLEPKGIGISLEISTLTTEQFKDAIMKITTDEKYTKNMKKVSRFFKDRPMHPLDTALWWMEFVLRHDSEEIKEFLQNRSVHQSWWVRRQLDVWLFLALAAILIVTVPMYVMWRLVKLVVCRSRSQKKIKQH